MATERTFPPPIAKMLRFGKHLSLLSVAVSLDMFADGILFYILRFFPTGIFPYVASTAMSVIVFAVLYKLTNRGRQLPQLLDLSGYDIIIQLIGLYIKYYGLNPAAPAPLPYTVLAITLVSFKLFCLAWPLMSSKNWPALGPFSLLCHVDGSPTSRLQTALIFLSLLLFGTLAYATLYFFPNERLDTRIPFSAAMYILFRIHYLDNVNASDFVHALSDDERQAVAFALALPDPTRPNAPP